MRGYLGTSHRFTLFDPRPVGRSAQGDAGSASRRPFEAGSGAKLLEPDCAVPVANLAILHWREGSQEAPWLETVLSFSHQELSCECSEASHIHSLAFRESIRI